MTPRATRLTAAPTGVPLRRFRAIALAVVIAANLIAAIPRVKMTPEERSDPELWKEDLARWHQGLGGALTPDQLRTIAVESAWAWRQFVVALRFPFEPFYRYTHTNQQWGLFAVVTERPERLIVEVRSGQQWERIYRRLDPALDWHDRQLKYRRIRGVWDSVKDPPKGTYKRLTLWIARTAFRERPDVDRVRVQLERSHLTLPWEPIDPERTYRAEKVHRRDKVMGAAPPEEIPADPPAPEGDPE